MALSTTWQSIDGNFEIGGTALRASAETNVSAADTAVAMGKGFYRFVISVTVIDTTVGDEGYLIAIEGNSNKDATYKEFANLMLDDTVGTGRSADSAIGDYEIYGRNNGDLNIRTYTYITGSTKSGITYSVAAYPVA